MKVGLPVLMSSTQLQDRRSFHIVDIEAERLRNVKKNARAKRAKLLFSIVIYM